ncbi:FAD-binding oxidoreductase [Moraxella nasibovis]|uniref:FAD-binding oxidoreductase n=1 Tax=Moraxella nasibovis TaxID=2904120 RepID=UPI00240EBDE1|nr:FAD-binding oxidoreductase [Moraxella nasibovis]WFF38252.1 FAD-binding oxidoreductase [Moraxella nasibovis]
MTHTAFLDEVRSILTDSQIKTDEGSLDNWGKDWTKHFAPDASAIVFPRTTEEVAQIVRLANEHKVCLVPSGGRTGLSAGAVAANGEVVVSFDKMSAIGTFYEADRMVEVEAGVITKALQEFAESRGLYYGVDFASAGSSQIGGNIGTNAGGIKVIRYGMTRNQILGLTVVTGKGDILELNGGMLKNATGYDFRHLFIGAEGTLGFVTKALIKLEKQPVDLTAMVLGVPDFGSVVALLKRFNTALTLTAFEFFDQVAIEKVISAGHAKAPFDSQTPFYVLLEFEAISDEVLNTAMGVFEQCAEDGLIVDGVMSQSVGQLHELWKLRESISETISVFTPYKNDVSVLITHLGDFIADIEKIVKDNYPDFEICWFGHIGDGNLHLNILKPENLSKDEFFGKCQVVNQYVFETVQKYKGSISAEHGVGMTKKPYLDYTRSLAEIEYMKAVKAVFDPNNIINRGKIFDV